MRAASSGDVKPARLHPRLLHAGRHLLAGHSLWHALAHRRNHLRLLRIAALTERHRPRRMARAIGLSEPGLRGRHRRLHVRLRRIAGPLVHRRLLHAGLLHARLLHAGLLHARLPAHALRLRHRRLAGLPALKALVRTRRNRLRRTRYRLLTTGDRLERRQGAAPVVETAACRTERIVVAVTERRLAAHALVVDVSAVQAPEIA